MTTLRLTVVGIFPLLIDKVTLPNSVVSDRSKKQLSPKEQAERKLYRNKQGRIGLPSEMLVTALQEATRTWMQIKFPCRAGVRINLKDILKIREKFLVFPIPKGRREVPWEIYTRTGRLRDPKRTPVSWSRPKLKEWGFTCTITFDETVITQEKFLEVFRVAGKFQGLGSFRPATQGPFGRFEIKEHKVVKAKKKKRVLV